MEVRFDIQHSIAKKLLTMIFSIYFVIIVVVTLVQMVFEFSHVKNAVIAELHSFENVVKPEIVRAAWKSDYEQIYSVLSSSISSGIIVGTSFEGIQGDYHDGYYWDKKKNIFHIDRQSQSNDTQGKGKAEPSGPSKTTLLSTKYQNARNEWLPLELYAFNFPISVSSADGSLKELGQVTLYSSNHVVLERVFYGYVLILINALIKTIALWIIYFIVSYFYLTKPLQNFVEAVKRVRHGQYENAKIIVDYKVNSELDKLGADFNAMVEELAEARHQLWATQQRLNDAFNSMPSILIGITAEGIVTDWNQSAATFTFVGAEVAKGKHLTDAYPPFAEYIPHVQKAMDDVEIQAILNIQKEIEEEKRYFDVLIYPLISTEFRGAVIRVDDVTQRVQMDSLMMQSEKMSSLGSLAAGVAHEINNPLGAILQGAQNIQRRVDPENAANQASAEALNLDVKAMQQYFEERKILKFLSGIRESGERAAKIVQNLLTFSRRTSEAKVLGKVVDVVNKAIELARTDYSLRKGTDFRQIQVNVHEEGQIPEIYMVIMEIEQVFLNILKNACQARIDIPNEPGVINISIALIKNGEFVEIKIFDNGPGMTDKVKKRIFEPFFTTKPPGIGTGLGLSVSNDIITVSHKGALSVESEVGKGTTFIIHLPTKKPDESELTQDFTVQNLADQMPKSSDV